MAKKRKAAEGGEDSGGGLMTKADAVRAAIAEGVDQPKDGVAFIKDKFGLDISPAMFSSYKTANKKKGGGRASTGRGSASASSSNGASGAADLARAVKNLVEKHGAAAIVDMAKVFA